MHYIVAEGGKYEDLRIGKMCYKEGKTNWFLLYCEMLAYDKHTTYGISFVSAKLKQINGHVHL